MGPYPITWPNTTHFAFLSLTPDSRLVTCGLNPETRVLGARGLRNRSLPVLQVHAAAKGRNQCAKRGRVRALTFGVVLGQLPLGRVHERHLELHHGILVHLPLHARRRVGLEPVAQGARFLEPEEESPGGHVRVGQEPLVHILGRGEAQSLWSSEVPEFKFKSSGRTGRGKHTGGGVNLWLAEHETWLLWV